MINLFHFMKILNSVFVLVFLDLAKIGVNGSIEQFSFFTDLNDNCIFIDDIKPNN